MVYQLANYRCVVSFCHSLEEVFPEIIQPPSNPVLVCIDAQVYESIMDRKSPLGSSTLLEWFSPSREPKEIQEGKQSSRSNSSLFLLPPGEKSKSMKVLEHILQTAFSLGMDRWSTMIAVGGGAASDVVGLAASLYKRGCRFNIIPSTLLAMVDASFGGKTGINYFEHKNMIGSFYPASEIRIHLPFILSLSERDYRSGLAEVVKSAMLGDARLLGLLEERSAEILDRDRNVLKEIIQRSIGVKAQVIHDDLYDLGRGRRAELNLGHTFAHALEAHTGLHSWTHGEAVAWGLLRALLLGEHIGRTPKDYRIRIGRLLENYGFQLNIEQSARELYTVMLKDKKHLSGKLYFVLQEGIGKTFLSDIPSETVIEVLERRV